MSVKIKLKRMGKIRNPQYRIIVADARTKRDGRAIEEIGKYHPKEDPSFIEVESERAQYWLGVGAQPTEAVTAIFKVSGDWQKFKGLQAPAPMRVAAPKADRKAVFEAAAKEAMDEPKPGATTPKKRTEKKADAEPKSEGKVEAKADAKSETKAEAKADAPVETHVETPAPEAAATAPVETPATEA